MNLFIGDHGHLRSGWRFVIFFAAGLLVATVIVGVFALILVLSYGQAEAEKLLESQAGFFVNGAVLLLVAVFVGWGCVALFERLKPVSLGWALHHGWWKDLLVGLVLGGVTLVLAALLASVLGGFKLAFSPNWKSAVETLLIAFVVFAVAAAGEEAMFRGYGLQTLTRANLAWLGIILTSVPFALVHLGNPHVSKFFTITNTILAGVWLGLAYLKTRSLWFALGIHWSWNWTMGALLGIPVSGVTAMTPEPLMHVSYAGPAWLNGGDYGLEGGLACTVALVVSSLLIWQLRFPKPSEEMLAASPEEDEELGGWVDPNRN